VHADERAELAGAQHGAEDRLVVEEEHARVGHEHLEAGDALLDHGAHLVEDGRRHVGRDHVERVVDQRAPFGLGVPGVERLPERAALLLDREVDDGGGAAVGRRQRARLEVVDRARAAERHVEMGVRVDAARDDVLALGVDGAIGLPELGPGRHQRRDLAVLDPQVGGEGVRRGDAGAVGDEGAHG
jgi:hypothetical protein